MERRTRPSIYCAPHLSERTLRPAGGRFGECRGRHLGWPNLLLRDKLPNRQRTGGWHGYRWQRRILIPTGGELGEAPAWLVVQGNRWRRRGQERQRLCLQSRRASDDRVRP